MSATLHAPSANGVHHTDDIETAEWRERLLTGDFAMYAEPPRRIMEAAAEVEPAARLPTIKPAPDLPELSDTDAFYARLLVRQFGDKLRYCHNWAKWLVYDGRRWAIDDTGAAKECCVALGKYCLQMALVADKTGREAWAERALKCESAGQISRTLSIAESMLPIRPAELDQHAWLFNATNGTIDLRTGELRAHNPADFLTQLGGCEYVPDAAPELWERTLSEIFADREDLIGYVWRLCGRALSGDTSEHLLPVLYGTGANGKSVLVATLMHVLGDYSYKANSDLLIARRGESHPTDVAALFGKRAVFAIETGEGRRLNEALVKELTGGDAVTARRMREDFWTFSPTFKLFLVTNHKPRVTGTDFGIWRRLRLIPFDRTFSEDEQDKALPQKLKAEAPAILGWLVRGLADWLENGMASPECVNAATRTYRNDEDVVGQFLDECCKTAPYCQVRAGDLYAAYRSWASDAGERELSQTAFGRRITERPGISKRTSNGVWYVGIALDTV